MVRKWAVNEAVVFLSLWQVDCTEARYLLAGAADGSVGVYDTQQPTFVDSALHVAKHEALFTVDKSVHLGHIFSVSSVQWYPVDTGLFVTGSYDKNINLWDTNTHQVSEGSLALSWDLLVALRLSLNVLWLSLIDRWMEIWIEFSLM